MLSPETARSFLVRLAHSSTTTWLALGPALYANELSFATTTSVYRFKHGVFLSRAKRASGSFQWPPAMRGLRLVGFLRIKDDRWSLSPRWREGAHAVLWNPCAATTDVDAFIVTSPTTSFGLASEGSQPLEPTPTSGVRTTPAAAARPPSIPRPLPSSMTRIHTLRPTG